MYVFKLSVWWILDFVHIFSVHVVMGLQVLVEVNVMECHMCRPALLAITCSQRWNSLLSTCIQLFFFVCL
jgi:hypothetical protein